MSIRVAIIGDGKMGKAISALAAENGCEVVAMVGEGQPVADALRNADVAIEFTQPDAAVQNIQACVKAGIPVVVGTTGWYDQLPAVSKEVAKANAGLLWSANFSLGVNVMLQLTRKAGELLKDRDEFQISLLEVHHTEKKDAPSGTAKVIAGVIREATGNEIPITSERTGNVVGTHQLTFEGKFEQIVLTHVAHDRRVFAEGALTAAKWLVGKKGVFTMADVL
jgi:4-hydroxy-tetrahydrodipicolinate reductase